MNDCSHPTNTIVLVFFLACAGLASANSFAADPCDLIYEREVLDQPNGDNTRVYALLNNQRFGDGCILGNTDTTAVRAQAQQLTARPPGPDRALLVSGLLEQLLLEFDDFPTQDCLGLEPQCVAGRHFRSLVELEQQIGLGRFQVTANTRNAWVPDVFVGRIEISDVSVADFVEQQCEQGIDQPMCRSAFELSAKLLRSGLAVNEIISAYARPVIEANDAFLSDLDKQWSAYLNGTSVQYPWELMVNAWNFRRNENNPAQFPPAPTGHFVLFHPSAAVELSNSYDSQRETEGAIVIELAGYKKWEWLDGRQRNRWGISAILSIADIDGMERNAYGLLLHMPIKNIAIGAVSRRGAQGSDVNLVINLDLAKLLQTYGNDDVNRFLPVQQ